MKKENRLINNENLLESASDMTDEEVYEMSKGIANCIFKKYPLLNQAGWTADDVLNHQLTYFYDKQSRGKESPLTLRYNITKQHFKNMMFREIDLACKYHLRSGKTQRDLDKNKVYLDEIPYDNSTKISDIIASELDNIENFSKLETSKDVDNEIYDNEVLSKITDELITIEDHSYYIKLNRQPILQINSELTKEKQEEVYDLIYDDSKCIYKKLTFRDLARYYYNNFTNKKFTTSDLKDVLVELDENGNYNQLNPKVIKNIMNQLKEEVSLKLFNNIGGEALC